MQIGKGIEDDRGVQEVLMGQLEVRQGRKYSSTIAAAAGAGAEGSSSPNPKHPRRGTVAEVGLQLGVVRLDRGLFLRPRNPGLMSERIILPVYILETTLSPVS